ncbi:Putrescine transport ATP-binding protein PotA [Enhygromyxa salina]|uniref:Putrescine transport ATP-binding protein PotA n=1 Tax=Enhygromyxa salina TaxID=215803 RepID=A0A0C2CR35_9BACT|nr:ABC transporter ATP-binding protein [Enhygromyxa salina]KIG13636.1 Putrescine transport ATP-binding protein PotA [Enhygromyxa salina]
MSAEPSVNLRARGLHKRFAGAGRGSVVALAGVDLELEAGRHVCVMGHSGSGKTTLLRGIAGLEPLDAGELWIGDQRVDTLAAAARPTRTVFQAPALFPHLSVLENVTFVDRLGRTSSLGRSRADAGGVTEAHALLERLGLDPAVFAARNIDALSGGERQRVALARALYRAPPWLLLDEPLSALDRPRRAALRRALAGIRKAKGIGMLHVTHHAADALALADTLVVMSRGRVLASAAPEQLYARPPDLETARLLGELSGVPDPARAGFLRPERLRIVAGEQGRVRARLLARSCVGPLWEHELAVEGLAAPILVARALAWEGSEACDLDWDDDDVLELT